mgnify:CR=1 FL=1
MLDFDPAGQKNINFSTDSALDKNSSVYEKYKKQRMENGFDDSETYSLDFVISQFILPRLKRFRELTNGFPSDLSSMTEWKIILDKMIAAFELDVKRFEGTFTDIEQKVLDEGFELFFKYYHSLWW